MATKKSTKTSAGVATKAASDAPDQEAPAITTRAQAEAHIRAVVGHCLGPSDTDAYAHWQALMAASNEEEARTVVTRGIKQPDGRLVPCGYPFAKTVLAHAFDGKDHSAVCPRRGTTTSFRSPVFPDVKA